MIIQKGNAQMSYKKVNNTVLIDVIANSLADHYLVPSIKEKLLAEPV